MIETSAIGAPDSREIEVISADTSLGSLGYSKLDLH